MRLLATIFLFYFSSLMAQPMVTLIHNGLTGEKQTCAMPCCQKHKQAEKKSSQKLPFGCCGNDMSNPFAQCCCCIGFIPQQHFTEIAALSNKTVLVYTNQNALIPNYSSGYWRPPELTV